MILSQKPPIAVTTPEESKRRYTAFLSVGTCFSINSGLASASSFSLHDIERGRAGLVQYDSSFIAHIWSKRKDSLHQDVFVSGCATAAAAAGSKHKRWRPALRAAETCIRLVLRNSPTQLWPTAIFRDIHEWVPHLSVSLYSFRYALFSSRVGRELGTEGRAHWWEEFLSLSLAIGTIWKNKFICRRLTPLCFIAMHIGQHTVPTPSTTALHSVKTGASTIHNYETLSGLRFAMFTNNDAQVALSSKGVASPSIRDALRHIYTEIWVETVVRSPLYRPGKMVSADEGGSDITMGKFDIRSTNFEKKLDVFLQSMPWFR